LNNKRFFAKLFKLAEKLLIKQYQYRTWQHGQRSSETLILYFRQAKTPILLIVR